MCVLYVSFGSKVRPIIVGCVAMGSALLCIFRSRLLVYSAGSGVSFVCTRACVCGCDGDVIYVDHDLKRCTGWW